ncbi:MAG: ROK family protein [Chordicoccus sp.]
MKDRYLVLDIGGTYTKYAVMDGNGEICSKNKRKTVKEGLDPFIDMLTGIFKEQSDGIKGIAVSSTGMIDSRTGFMENGGSLFFIQNVNLAQILSERCGVPVTIENDARCAALAEVWKGSLKDCRNAAAFIIGTAVGGAVIIDRKVLSGRHCMAGEFSYILTNADHAADPQMTFANRGGVPALLRMSSASLGIPENELTGEIIFEKANRGDETVLACVRAYARNMAVQITNCQFMFDPERIAIGGGISEQPLLIQLIREELEKLNAIYPHKVPVPEVAVCRFFNDANLIGALYVHLQSSVKETALNEGA